MGQSAARVLDFPRERCGNDRIDVRPTDPSEEEIRRLCEEIQADWSDSERLARQLWMPVNRTLVRPNQADLERFTIPRVKVG